jgi:nitrate reductase gamma subunit
MKTEVTMDVLAFGRGPALAFAVTVFLAGTAWRLFGLLRYRASRDASQPRASGLAVLGRTLAHLWPRTTFRRANPIVSVNALAWHVALAIVVLGFVPHIQFFRHMTGLSWPAVPGWVFGVAVAACLFGLTFALMMRLATPVTRLLSGFDDYASWAVTMLPFLTGMAAIYLPLDAPYPWQPEHPTAVAIHLLSAELLLGWLPFGKLGHTFLVFFSRGATAAAFARKGAAS